MCNITIANKRFTPVFRKQVIARTYGNNPEFVITAIREMGLNNPVQTENAWHEFYSMESGRPVFHVQLLKKYLFEKGFMTLQQFDNDNCTMKEIANAVFRCLQAGIFPIKATKQTGILGYSPFRLSRDFSGKMRGKWAFTTLSLINTFCLARMKNPELVCFYCYVEKALKQNTVGMLNYIQNFYLMTAENLPEILIPVLNDRCIKDHNGIRIESFGDIQNAVQQAFYTKLTYKNPDWLFTQWSKNPAIVCQVFDKIGKPENLKFGLSMSRINKLDADCARWIRTGYIDFMFVVCDNDAVRDDLLDIPFSRPCMCEEYSCYTHCKKCYLQESDFMKKAGRPALAVERLRK